MMSRKILAVATSADMLGDQPTGLWLEELAAPYYVLKDKGYDVVIASTKGGRIPLDPASLQEQNMTDHTKKFLEDEQAKKQLENSLAVSEVRDVKPYVAMYVPGGHGIMVDGPGNPVLNKLLADAARDGKVVSAVCHGPAAFVGANIDGKPIVRDKKVTSFSNSEEKSVGKDTVVPFLLEDKLKELGAEYQKGKDWSPVVVKDGYLITGQNPQSSAKLAEEIAATLGH